MYNAQYIGFIAPFKYGFRKVNAFNLWTLIVLDITILNIISGQYLVDIGLLFK